MKKENFLWNATKTGLLGGAIALFICLIGMAEVFSKRDVIEDIITLGQFVLLATSVMGGLLASRRTSHLVGENKPLHRLTAGLVGGLMTGIVLALFVLAGDKINIRAVFLNASPALYNILTFEKGVSGVWVLPAIGAVSGLIGAAFLLLPQAIQKPLTQATLFLFFMALFSGLFRVVMINQGTDWEKTAKYLYGQTGVTSEGALIFFFAVVVISSLWSWRGQRVKTTVNRLPKGGQLALRLLAFAAIGYVALGLPQVSGPFIAQVIVTVALFILMGLGLNITLGFAGLLDLGFVAFYAIGAYTVGLLTSYGPFGLQHISFWAAVPIAVLVAMSAGFVLGLPVLGVRGDYLAIATLGFGEIVRLLAGSDFLAKYFGGPQGVIGIQKPCIGMLEPFVKIDVPRVCNGIELGKPQDIYYLAVASAILIAFVAWRLDGHPRGRGCGRSAGRQPHPDQVAGLHARRGHGWTGRRDLRHTHRLHLRQQYATDRIHQRGVPHHCGRYGKHPWRDRGCRRPDRPARTPARGLRIPLPVVRHDTDHHDACQTRGVMAIPICQTGTASC
jgi:branched-chain amino acid transport system permease protein